MVTVKGIQQEIESLVKKETGATVEVTIINASSMSVFATSEQDLVKAHTLLGVEYMVTERVAYPEDSEYCWFYSIVQQREGRPQMKKTSKKTSQSQQEFSTGFAYWDDKRKRWVIISGN
jgi:hypothetical protein